MLETASVVSAGDHDVGQAGYWIDCLFAQDSSDSKGELLIMEPTEHQKEWLL